MGPSDDILLDLRRADRVGLDEAVLCADKTVVHVLEIARQAHASGRGMLFTRVTGEQESALRREFPELDHDAVSRTAILGSPRPPRGEGRVAVVAAGTSDAQVAREAVRTLAFAGEKATVVVDVGVAGIWRLVNRLEELRRHPVVIVVAGMDAALPTVVGGLVGSALVAVPTSVGYGVATGGHAALNSMLSSCAQGVPVMNIDNGFGAACAALRILNAAERLVPARG